MESPVPRRARRLLVQSEEAGPPGTGLSFQTNRRIYGFAAAGFAGAGFAAAGAAAPPCFLS